ncbi:uncharacterized protein LOC121467591 isoform X2 [Drosophila elegans]|uniref:uncharacterized protein LOC121467591 isoform X2 n=1 Tax=Drosophila elegans TaxID=30023 RepID=UPI001BC86015|nr:uncharacterized protein LOC121467591 isoform X2 [Drosophila elegans]
MERESPKKLEDALEEMGMQGVLPYLQEAGVTLSLLESVTEEELKEAVPQLGLRMLFNRKLTIWREKMSAHAKTKTRPILCSTRAFVRL